MMPTIEQPSLKKKAKLAYLLMHSYQVGQCFFAWRLLNVFRLTIEEILGNSTMKGIGDAHGDLTSPQNCYKRTFGLTEKRGDGGLSRD
jgi:hypothetical protein